MITPCDITVSIACVFESMDPVWMMETTLKRFGYSYKPYGLGEVYGGWIDINVVRLMCEAINCPTSHILYTDARDAWFCCGPEEVADKYNALGCPPLLLSAQDRGAGGFEEFYKGIPWDLTKPFPYMWPTGKLCEAKTLAECLQWMMEHAHGKVPGDDPVYWLEYMRAFPGAVTLDHDCSIFMNAGSGNELWEDGTLWICGDRVFNGVTGTCPAILHFGGGYSHATTGKWDRIEKYWKAFGYTERPPWEKA